MTMKRRSVILPIMILMLCLALLAGGTYALFSDQATLTNHLESGTLHITLKRTALVKKTLDASGYLTETTVQTTADDPVDFTGASDQNVFGLLTDDAGNVLEKIVPGSKYVATMQIENNSDVAFGYWIKILCNDEDAAKALAGQLILTVYTDKNGDGIINTESEGDERIVAEGLSIGSDTAYIGVLAVGDAETFIVSVEFADQGYTYENGVLSSVNNSAQAQDVAFDLVVYALQKPTAPAAP